MGNFEKALEICQDASFTEKFNGESFALAGFINQLQGNADEAVENYHHALRLNRNQIYVQDLLELSIRESVSRE